MNLNHLVVAIYARAAMDREETGTSDLGVAAAKIRNNIRQGRVVDSVTGIPDLYIPDWTALHNWEKSVGEDAFAQDYQAALRSLFDSHQQLLRGEAQGHREIVCPAGSSPAHAAPVARLLKYMETLFCGDVPAVPL